VHNTPNRLVALAPVVVIVGAVFGCGSLRDQGPTKLADLTMSTDEAPCPTGQPSEGMACEGVAPTCEYGGDAFARCTTLATCLLVDGKLGWHLTSTACPSRNDPLCPATFSAHQTGTPCPAAGKLGCEYDEGRCGCECATDGSSRWECRRRDEVQPMAIASIDAGASCSAKRPLAGSPCDETNVLCPYTAPCSIQLSLGPNLACMFGHWRAVDPMTVCPPATCAATR
jgi:hypothetical protein